ncbi:MAG TPA: hypothetical protein VER32_07555 [Pyrinomonadaceae bacterium]|nr:hypothetical protein [Pyrinomonadaceae bacterium]
MSSNSFDPKDPLAPGAPGDPTEPLDDLVLRDDEFDEGPHRERNSSTMRETLNRIPESLSSIGRDISRTIERAISAKDEYVVAVRVSHEAQDKLDQLVLAGVFRSRAEAAAFLIDEGIKSQEPLFGRVEQKLSEIERLRAELRGMINRTE